jgi:HK97 family phage major capsid protein
MNITEALRKWLSENCDIKIDATEDECRKAVSDALIDGKLSAEKYAELSQDEKAGEANEFDKKLGKLADGLSKLTQALAIKEETKEEEKETKEEENKETETEKKETKEETKEKKMSPLAMKIAQIGGTPIEPDGDESVEVRVKAAVESYDSTKTALHYPEKTEKGTPHSLAGKRVRCFDRALDTSSERDKALAGVWAKFQVWGVTPRVAGSAHAAWERFSEHEKSLLCYLAEECDWDDSTETASRTRKGYPGGIKQLIDDAASGGFEAAPIVFDDEVIQTPLLHGELYPLVHEKPIERGRRIEGVSTGTVTGGWGGVDDTAVALFNTANYVAAFDTTIYRWEGAIRIGLDFLSDTPIDFNAHVTAQYGQRLLEDLDDVIATGNGTTQPQGIMNAAGATVVAFGAATNLANYEGLRFSIAKPEHSSDMKASAVFCGTETSYSRAIGIPVGAADARRVFGTLSGPNYDGYSIMQRPYKINESLTNQQIFYAIMKRYRMYRRKGLAVRTSTEGDTLIRRNEVLIVVMARYGGQQERGATIARTTTAPA